MKKSDKNRKKREKKINSLSQYNQELKEKDTSF